jgi:hypothetical protein
MKTPTLLLIILFISCSSKNKYAPSNYFDLPEQDAILTSIISHVFEAPPHTKMKDRFSSEHRAFYTTKTKFFTLEKLFKTEDGKVYFYITRPTPDPKNKRGVGGYFKFGKNFIFSEFRELFVTSILPMEDVKGRCGFLFDEMIKGNIKQYEKMTSFIQWPNEVSYYDTITYEWKLKSEFEKVNRSIN